VKSSLDRSRFQLLHVGLVAGVVAAVAPAQADIPLNDPEKADGWAVSTSGQVNAHVIYIFGETVNRSGVGNLVNPGVAGDEARYRLVGPQINIQGSPEPGGAISSAIADNDVNTFRVRGGFASTILNFMVKKQVLPDLKLDIKMGIWAGIDNAPTAGGVRQKNDVATVDWREQFVDLSGSWGTVWGGRKLSLFSRGTLRMNWNLIHQHGVGHPCNVDGGGIATCGHTGVGSMFPNRNAQIGYATPDFGGLQVSVAVFDSAMINDQWNRAPLPRLEAEATFRKDLGGDPVYKDEINIWVNGLSQTIGRNQELLPMDPVPPAMIGTPGIGADAERTVWGVSAGAWGRLSGFALGLSGWMGDGLGTATPFGNTAVDDSGELRSHFGYLAIANYRRGQFEVAASYGSSNVRETDWDKSPDNPAKISLIKEVRGIGGKLAYHVVPSLILSIDGMAVSQTWWRGEDLHANIVSAGLLARW
jgi:hypothetical protein